MKNEILQRIVDDLNECDWSIGAELVNDMLFETFYMKEEFTRKLVVIAAEYLVEIEKRDNQLIEKNKQIYSLNRELFELRKYCSIPYKDDMKIRKEKGIYPASKGIPIAAVGKLVDLGMTQVQVARQLNISRSTVNRYLKKWREERKSYDFEKERYRLTGL